MTTSEHGADRRARLATARLYLVCGASPERHDLPELIRAAAAGGVDIFQLREKHLPDDELAAVADTTRVLCERLGMLFIINDHPSIALQVGADGVHVGQDDMEVGKVREMVGPGMLVGLSTHSPTEIAAVDRSVVDYIGVGPIWATPTKPGRPAVGLELIRHAASRSPVPFFAIGGLDASNITETIDAGAGRVCVLRAITDAAEPEQSARVLRDMLG